jgi:hypothetical protein
MTGNQTWLPVILIEEIYAHTKNRTRNPPDNPFRLRGLSVQAKR